MTDEQRIAMHLTDVWLQAKSLWESWRPSGWTEEEHLERSGCARRWLNTRESMLASSVAELVKLKRNNAMMGYRKKELDRVNAMMAQAFVVSRHACTYFGCGDAGASVPLFEELSKLESMVRSLTELVGRRLARS